MSKNNNKEKKKLTLDDLTVKQREKLLFTPCKTKEELSNFIQLFFGFHLPDYTVSRFADTNPLDVVWEVYNICVNKNNPDDIDELLYVASRGSGKTLGMAIAEILVVLHDNRDVCHVGAVMAQAKRCYEYQTKFMMSPKIRPILEDKTRPHDERVLQKMNMEKSIFKIDDQLNSIEVLPCTLSATNGPHVPFVCTDEIDTVSGEGLKAFKEISGMIDSKGGKRALRVGISTRKSRYGLMNRMLEDADHAGRHVRKWTAFEFAERCPDSRSGTTPTVSYHILDEMEVIDEDTYERKDAKKQKEYTKHVMPGEKCLDCPAAAICLGDAKKQKSKSWMLKPITDVIQKVRAEGVDWALAQLMNLKPSVEGIIYKEFTEKQHVNTWNEMWYKLTGVEYPGECTHDMFVKKCFSADTEVLTNNGFKYFYELTPYDTVASLDDDGNLIYETPTDYIAKPYSGKMVNLYNKIGGHGKQLDLLVTEDHQQTYVSSSFRRDGKFDVKKKSVNELPGGDFYVPAAPMSSDTDSSYGSPISYMTDEQFYSFLGLWLSEGSMSSVRANETFGHNEISVSQHKGGYWQEVDELMNSIEWPSRLYFSADDRQEEGGSWSVFNKELYDYLKEYKFAVNKSIPRVILEQASREQLSILMKWLMLGDGSNYDEDDKQQPYYGTGSRKLADDVQELAFRLGYRTNLTTKYDRDVKHTKSGTRHLDMYRVHIHSKSDKPTKKMWYIGNGTAKSEFSGKRSSNVDDSQEYTGMVYCVTMPSGRLFVRRNGVVALSGNCHSMKLNCYAGVDWGWSSPNTVVYFFIDKKDNVFVVRSDGMTYVSQPEWVHYIKHKYHNMYRCQLYFPDIADQGAITEMRKAGLTAASENDKSINTGIQVIKKLLRVPGTSDTKIHVAKETNGPLIEEFLSYHFKTAADGTTTEVPDSENDHWLDALRYALTMLLGKNTLLASGDVDSQEENVADKTGSVFYKTPTPEEYAKVNNMNVTTEDEIDKSKLGKVGKESELLDEDDDEWNGDGGFLWSL